MKCPYCQSNIRKGSSYCTQCGYKLPEKKHIYIIGADIGIIVLLIAIKCFLYIKNERASVSSTTEAQVVNSISNTSDSFSNYEITKYFVSETDHGNVYYSVELNFTWPLYLKGGYVDFLQKGIISKVFGYSEANIDKALATYFQSMGTEIVQLPEISDTTHDQRYIKLSIDKKNHIEGKYIAFSISYLQTAYGSSIHAADYKLEFLNYDITNGKFLSLQDILAEGITYSDLLNELKQHLTIDWLYVDQNILPAVLLTNDGLYLWYEKLPPDKGKSPVSISLSHIFISPHVKDLLLPDYKEDKHLISKGLELLKSIYNNYVFSHNNFLSNANDVFDENIGQRLNGIYASLSNFNDDKTGYAMQMLRTSYQDGPSKKSCIRDIIYKGQGWFEVSYLDMGHEGKTSFKLIMQNGKAIINDIVVDKTFVPSF